MRIALHWLSYPNYAALISGHSFTTNELAAGDTDIFIALALKVLEAHPGLARIIIGALMNAIYNRNGQVKGRTLFLLDKLARLGFLRILETACDAGRKYGHHHDAALPGNRPDARSLWWTRRDLEMVRVGVVDQLCCDQRSRDRRLHLAALGRHHVGGDQLSRSSQMSGASRTRSKLLARRPLILPHEVLRMRADEQIVFTAVNPPLRYGRAIWFRREDMKSCVGENRFHRKEAVR
ncbi:type IV secretory system conjugative DNA transfer family protein [Mesorhizobium yinganensis]|uniref:type IV secretory system conjugative DNA transfer family protein n=1 Tax=Mesorhizobium yinganensis TaxID=3157707 RepID=UPI003CCCBC68